MHTSKKEYLRGKFDQIPTTKISICSNEFTPFFPFFSLFRKLISRLAKQAFPPSIYEKMTVSSTLIFIALTFNIQ